MKKTPEGANRGAGPVPRALITISVLLTIGTAATDVACFTRLGSVFASVMTSNLVFTGAKPEGGAQLLLLAACRAPVTENGPAL